MTSRPIPEDMEAAVYRGRDQVALERLPVPEIGPGEVLVRVAACGVCGTDIKKVRLGKLLPPRVFGHETAGTIAAVGEGVSDWAPGDRVALYHHVPDRSSWYSQRGLYAQCPQYKKTGITAGFEPSGGGYAEYVRVMPWIVEQEGMVRVPDDVSLETAAFVEPVNTCLKGVRTLQLDEGDTVLIGGLGSIGIILAQLARREGARVIGAEPLAERRERAEALGIDRVFDPTTEDVVEICDLETDGRGADHAIVAVGGEEPIAEAVAATRAGARILLFANTKPGEIVGVDVGTMCVQEKQLIGAYSASVDLNEEAAHIVFAGEIELPGLITHRYPLSETAAAIDKAGTPAGEVGKVMVIVNEEDAG